MAGGGVSCHAKHAAGILVQTVNRQRLQSAINRRQGLARNTAVPGLKMACVFSQQSIQQPCGVGFHLSMLTFTSFDFGSEVIWPVLPIPFPDAWFPWPKPKRCDAGRHRCVLVKILTPCFRLALARERDSSGGNRRHRGATQKRSRFDGSPPEASVSNRFDADVFSWKPVKRHTTISIRYAGSAKQSCFGHLHSSG